MEVASAGDGLELKADPRTSTNSIRLLVAICVVGLLVGVAGLVAPRLFGSRDEFAAERQAVITRASDFAVTYNTFSSDKKTDYQGRVKPLLTRTYYKDFLKTTNVMFKVAHELAKDRTISSGDVNVRSVAVDSIDSDSASALVAFDAKVNPGGSKSAVPVQFRYHVSMQKVRGEWRVDRTDDVPPIEASLADVTEDAKSGDNK